MSEEQTIPGAVLINKQYYSDHAIYLPYRALDTNIYSWKFAEDFSKILEQTHLFQRQTDAETVSQWSQWRTVLGSYNPVDTVKKRKICAERPIRKKLIQPRRLKNVLLLKWISPPRAPHVCKIWPISWRLW